MTKKEKIMQKAFELSSAPNKRYETFFIKTKEYSVLDPSDWKIPHIIGYFCNLYETRFGVKYSFKFNAMPSKCYETFQVNRLTGMLGTDPLLIKEYIDWVFDKKLQSDKKFLVIGFLANEKLVSEFQFAKRKASTAPLTRSTILSPTILQILEDLDITSVKTYGDLAFLKQAEEEQFQQIYNKLNTIGFDISCLDKVK